MPPMIGSSRKIEGEYTKVVLRQAMSGRIPEIVRKRVRKFGFPTSAKERLRATLLERCRDVHASRATRESGVWNVAAVGKTLDRHERGIENAGDRMFKIMQVASWFALSRLCVLLQTVFSALPAQLVA